MARSVPSSNLRSRTERLKLPRGYQEIWVKLGKGLSLGYRPLATDPPWIIRQFTGQGRRWMRAFATADDRQESNGTTVLNFIEAQEKAFELARGGPTADAPMTVDQALSEYEADLKGRNGLAANVSRVRKWLPVSILNQPVATLSMKQLRNWRDGLTANGMKAATVNRTLTPLRAALEFVALGDQRIKNHTAWRVGLAKVHGAHRSRNIVLVDPPSLVPTLVSFAYAECPAFGLMVETAASTGCRLSQIGRLETGDLIFRGNKAWLNMPTSMKGAGKKKIERYLLGIPMGLALKLKAVATGRDPHERLLLQADGKPWSSADIWYWQAFRRVAEQAGCNPDEVTLNSLRHTSITRQLMANVPIAVIAKAHNTSVQQIQATYGKFVQQHADDVYRAHMLDLSPVEPAANVVPLQKKG